MKKKLAVHNKDGGSCGLQVFSFCCYWGIPRLSQARGQDNPSWVHLRVSSLSPEDPHKEFFRRLPAQMLNYSAEGFLFALVTWFIRGWTEY